MKTRQMLVVCLLLLIVLIFGAGYASQLEADRIYALRKGVAIFEKNHLWGLMDSAGNIVLPAQYSEISWYGKVLRISKGKLAGIVDSTGRVIAEAEWDEIYGSITDQTTYTVKRGNKYGLISESGYIISEPQWDHIRSFQEGYAVVQRDRLYGYIDTSGRVMIEPQYVSAASFSEGLACVQVDDNVYQVIDHKGEVVFTASDYVAVRTAWPCLAMASRWVG